MNNLTYNNKKKKSQVISLSKARIRNRNKHISSLIDSIQDNGPAHMPAQKTVSKITAKMNKVPLVMITRTPGNSQEPNTKEQSSPSPVKTENRKSVAISAILITTLLLSASVYAINSLNTRINTLEQQVSEFNERLSDSKSTNQ